jgi:hypothetical protein
MTDSSAGASSVPAGSTSRQPRRDDRAPGAGNYGDDKVRKALDLDPHVPLLLCDARDRESSKRVLISLVQHVLSRRQLSRHEGLTLRNTPT